MSISRRRFLKTSAATAAALALWRLQSRPADAADVRHRSRPVPAGLGLAGAVPMPGMVPGRQVRHLGALDRPVRPRAGRLVRPPDVLPGQWRLQLSVSPTTATRPKSASRTLTTSGTPKIGTPRSCWTCTSAAGAKYFVSLANHHDNFDNWNSKYQTWNSVALGPKKDIVGTWAKAARKRGLRFGVTVHAARTWDWFDVSHGADKTGPLAGVPYDGNLTKADGKGQWWDGLRPRRTVRPRRRGAHRGGPQGLRD